MNNIQSEQSLENELIEQLKSMEYDYITLKDENDLLSNLRNQLEMHNNIMFSDSEFKKVLNHLNK
jgi:type I restriction enzyme R subunit